MKINSILACGLGLGLSASYCLGESSVVYPTPQKAEYAGSRVEIPKKILRIDRSDKKQSSNKLLKDVPELSGAYRLKITPEAILIAGHDKRGVFYAEQTLAQLKDAKNTVPVVEILDWPDLAFRGSVEGFYGTPWSHQARLNQLKFYGKYKMNTYIYGPKDDPYHSARWREPYPAKEEEQIRELVKVAKDNHVDFVWAIHPGHNIKWTDEDMHNVIKKFQLMYDLGVRSFSVFFDDIGGEGTRGDMQAKLLNMINDEFVKVKGDVTPLVMCPTQYNRGWSSGDYLDVLGDNLHKETNVMWTGNSVCADITMEGQDWVNKRLKRPSYIWWNFPVTDYVRDHLCLGRIYGLPQEPGAKDAMSGLVSNPMDKPEASKIALFGVADYTWNIDGFKSDKAWKDGIKRIFPKASDAMQTFVNHNSDQGPNGHGYRREESVAIAPLVKSILEEMKSGKVDQAKVDQLKKEYQKMSASIPVIKANANNDMFLAEVGPWLDAFEQLGVAGDQALLALSQVNKSKGSAVTPLVEATRALHRMDVLSKANNKNPYQPGVKTGSLVMTPAVDDIVTFVGNKVYSDIKGSAMVNPQPISSVGNKDGLIKICDGNKSSFWHSGVAGKAGDWVGVDYGAQVPIRSISIATGRKSDDKSDYVAKGQIEVSQDMQKWVPLGSETVGTEVEWKGDKSIQARGVRYRTIDQSQIDGRPSWLAVREIAINAPSGPRVNTNIDSLKGMSAARNDKMVNINRVMETHTMKPQQFIELVLPQPIDATWLEIDVRNPDVKNWGEISLIRDGQEKPVAIDVVNYEKGVAVKDAAKLKGVKGLRLTNKGNQDQEISVDMFKFDAPADDPTRNEASLSDANLKTFYAADEPLNVIVPNLDVANPTTVTVIGSAACNVFAQSGNGWVNIGKKPLGGKGIATFKLPAKCGAVKLVSDKPQKGEMINEVIFKSSK